MSGSLPSVALKRVALVRYGLGQPPPLVDAGVPILRATNIERGRIVSKGLIFATAEDLPIDRTPLLGAGEVLVVRSGAYTGDSALVTPDWAGASPGYDLRLTPRGGLESRFLAYSMLGRLATHAIDIVKSRAAQSHLNAEDLGALPIVLPPLEQQRRIADFLDAETSRIDALITAKQRMLELQDDRIGSSMYQALAKGTRREATKASGIEWIEEIPASWGRAPVSAHFSVQLGKMLNPEASGGDDQRRYLRNTNVQWDRLDTGDLASMSFAVNERATYALKPGDLLVCEGGEVGRAALWNETLGECYFQKAIHRVRPAASANSRFLMYCLWVAADLNVFRIDGNQSTIVHLTAEKLRAHRFPWPPPDQQAEIVDQLDLLRQAHSALTTKLTRQIELLRERRQALITAAVTGELVV